MGNSFGKKDKDKGKKDPAPAKQAPASPASSKGGASPRKADRTETVNKRASGEEEIQVARDQDDGEVKDDGKGDNADEAYSYWDKQKTFKPNKAPVNAKQQRLQKTIKATMKATLGGGELRKTVKLPDGEDVNEWIAVNTVHFYNAANMIYGTCTEFCTDESCPIMSAGPKYEYLWKDGVKYKKPTKVSAPVYIDNLLNWVNEQISDPKLFPVDERAQFPKNFMSQVKQIYKRLFRLYAHIYYSHIDNIRAIGANAHLNTCFKHFVYFILEFNLVEDEEMAPLRKLISKFSKEQ
jgi:MOB kinase activator 1